MFALTADESQYSSDFRLYVQASIVEGLYYLQDVFNLTWYETVDVLYKYPTGNPGGMFMEVHAKTTGEPLVCQSTDLSPVLDVDFFPEFSLLITLLLTE